MSMLTMWVTLVKTTKILPAGQSFGTSRHHHDDDNNDAAGEGADQVDT